jgi:hypothetical protein
MEEMIAALRTLPGQPKMVSFHQQLIHLQKIDPKSCSLPGNLLSGIQKSSLPTEKKNINIQRHNFNLGRSL